MLTLARCCEMAANYDLKRLIDDRTILRREANGADFISAPVNGRTICDIDDAAALILYAEMRRAGQPVKVAGLFASRVRDVMRSHPEADQLTMVTLENGSIFTLPSASLDLSSGYVSGGFVVTATLVHIRNLRQRVQREIEVENVAA